MTAAAPWVLPQLLIVIVLVVSGVAKLRESVSTASAFAQLQLPGFLRTLRAPRLLPWGELALAALLLVVPRPWAWLPAAAGLVLMLTYLGIIVRALRFPYPVTCNCFGRLGLGLVEAKTAWRNALLSAIAAVSVYTAWRQGSVVQQLIAAPAAVWWWLLGIAVTVLLTWFVVGGSGTRIVHVPAAPAADGALDDADYLRTPTPLTTVVDAQGIPQSIRTLARREAHLLIFLSPTCGACEVVAEAMPRWAERLGPVRLRAVFYVPLDTLPDEPMWNALTADALHDKDGALSDAFGGLATPSAVLLGTDDLLAGGPITGNGDVVEFVEDVIGQIHEAE
ncbi:MauE/DoxX family redox-associated membrane protein [Kribbia dieselivorans]|uniref:MauE/DoxX family redox-associated membrane protein n=1 Tax=Kribbia dieselivorans TaxID=331526 RepID=UPI000838D7EC|nr:MauE/DoxX family redox-associated membrane protein [Kribbia dieselivorans]